MSKFLLSFFTAALVAPAAMATTCESDAEVKPEQDYKVEITRRFATLSLNGVKLADLPVDEKTVGSAWVLFSQGGSSYNVQYYVGTFQRPAYENVAVVSKGRGDQFQRLADLNKCK